MNLQMLKDATQSQLEILHGILQLEKEKHEYLLSGKLKDFSTINQGLVENLEKLEIAELFRNNAMEELTTSNPSIFEGKMNIHFADIVKALEGFPEHEEMKSMYYDMKESVEQIRFYTNMNKDLIEMALNVLNITLKQQNKEIDYTKRSEAKENHSFLVNKVI